MKKMIAALLALCMLALPLCGCANIGTAVDTTTDTTIEKPSVTPTDEEAAGDLLVDYVAQAVSERETDGTFVSAMLNFSAELFTRTLSEDKKNSLISPLSALIALGMVSNGAENETKAQFEKVFGFSIDAANEYLYTLVKELYNGDGAKMELANSIWFSKDGRLNVSGDFLQTTKNYYEAQACEEDFFAQATVYKINGWVSEHTDEMIDKIIDEIDPDCVMILINALVFDALWKEQYEDYTCSDMTFKNYDGTESTVIGMRSEEGKYISGKGVCGFTKNYEKGYKFVALLPDGDIFDFIKTLDGETLSALLGSAKSANVRAVLPQFEYDYELDLREALCDMGLTDAFDPYNADFDGLGECANNLYIGAIQHKTHIELTAAGTRAAAVTAIYVKETSYSPIEYTVTLDRPFVYLIIDSENNIPLFIGVVTEIK